MTTLDGRTVNLFGRVYHWHDTALGLALRPETDAERDARLEAAGVALDAARERAQAIAGDDPAHAPALSRTLAQLDQLERQARA